MNTAVPIAAAGLTQRSDRSDDLLACFGPRLSSAANRSQAVLSMAMSRYQKSARPSGTRMDALVHAASARAIGNGRGGRRRCLIRSKPSPAGSMPSAAARSARCSLCSSSRAFIRPAPGGFGASPSHGQCDFSQRPG